MFYMQTTSTSTFYPCVSTTSHLLPSQPGRDSAVMQHLFTNMPRCPLLNIFVEKHIIFEGKHLNFN